jgi:FKBP-type peptidyl-prolyl cis-trans isomerase (trigger factor)
MREHPELDEESRERLALEAEKEAARRMRHELVVAAVGREEQVQVERAEAENAFQTLIRGGLELPDDSASRERMVENLRDSIYERKVLKLLVDRADLQVIEQSRRNRRIATPFNS